MCQKYSKNKEIHNKAIQASDIGKLYVYFSITCEASAWSEITVEIILVD